MASINIQPPILDLALYAGDGISFRLICKDEGGSPVPIDGEIEAQVRVNRDVTSDAIVQFSSNLVDADEGIISLSLTGEQTQQLMDDPSVAKGKFVGVWDVQWSSVDAEPRTLCQGKVECVADVTR